MVDLIPLVVAVGASFIVSFLLMPRLIQWLRSKRFVVKDYYKEGHKTVPTQGAIIILFVCLLLLLIFPILSYFVWRLNKFLIHSPVFGAEPYSLTPLANTGVLVVAMYGLYGLLDDYIKIGHRAKILIPILFGLPLITPLYDATVTIPFFGTIDNTGVLYLPFGGDVKILNVYRIIVVPIYIMVTANLVNMHSGFNGLQSGLSTIVLFFLILKSIIAGSVDNILGIGAICGSLLAFWWFNKYPSRVFSGNTGSLALGAAVGVLIVTQGFLVSGLVMLIPHIVDFLMFAYIKVRKMKFVKFGKIRDDGTIEAPNPIKMKFLLPYYFRMTEGQTVYMLYAITMAFCLIGLFIPF